VEVHDEEIMAFDRPYDLPREVLKAADKIRLRLDKILDGPLAPEEQLPPLADQTRERTKAFALRKGWLTARQADLLTDPEFLQE